MLVNSVEVVGCTVEVKVAAVVDGVVVEVINSFNMGEIVVPLFL